MEDERARDDDRNAAIAAVEAAWADGQIIEADRDKRVELLQMAQTTAEIRMLTHDLEPPMPAAVPPPAAAPPTQVNYGPATPTPLTPASAGSKPRVSRALILVPIAVVAIIAVASIGGIVALVSSVGDSIEAGPLGEDPDVLSEAGYQDLLDAVEEETGRTTAFSAVLYPTYAVLELPVDKTSQREEYWYWDGSDLEPNDSKSTSSYARTDLAQIDPAVIVDLIEQVRANVDDPNSWYAIVRAPDDDRAVIWAYATNEYSETEYLGARRDGTITYDSSRR